jgi:hypothetical protein
MAVGPFGANTGRVEVANVRSNSTLPGQKPSIPLLGGPPFFIVALLPGVIRFDLGVQMSKVS